MVKYCKNLTDNGIKCVYYTRKTCKYPHMMKKYTTVLAALLAVSLLASGQPRRPAPAAGEPAEKEKAER